MDGTQKLLRFGLFELNLDTEVLRKDGIPLKLSPQPFRILTLLASHAGQIVTRDEIREKIWGGETYVDFDHGLNQCIKQIRTVLGDNPDNPLYVETLPRRGYRFVAPVRSKTVNAPPPNVVESYSGIAARQAVTPTPSSSPSGPAAHAAAAAPALSPTPLKPVSTKIPPSAAGLGPAATGSAQALEEVTPRKGLRFAGTAIAAVALIAGGFYWHSQKANALTGREPIVVADFNNTTGSDAFDNTLKLALSIKLEESPHLNVLSDKKVANTLKLMDRPVTERLSRPVAREICQRNNSRAYIAGSISQPADQYIITLTAFNCETDQVLASVDETAENQERVLHALGQATIALRKKLGESLASVQRFDKPLEEVTTSSFDALKAFSQARRAQMTGAGDPFPSFKRALDLDPNFAPAYAAMGSAYFNVGETSLAIQNYKKAFELRDRVSEKERYLIDSLYYAFATGELDKAIQTCVAWIQNYPGDDYPHALLGAFYDEIGQYEKAASELRERSRLISNLDDNLVEVYACLNRFDEAQTVLDTIAKGRADAPFLRQLRYFLAFLHGDNSAMQQNLDWSKGNTEVGGSFLSVQSDTEAYHGRLAEARKFSERATDAAKLADSSESTAKWTANEALREAEIGNFEVARKKIAEALSAGTGVDTQTAAALALARSGDVAQAQKLVEMLDREFPLNTMTQSYSLPTIRAAIELQKNNPGGAIEILQAATPYELGNPSGGGGPRSLRALYPVYVRGQAYLQAGQGHEASLEFQKVLDHPGVVWNSILGALAHVQLGRAQALLGDKAAARKSYQDFFALWKDADPEIPIFKAANAEYKMLN